MYTITIIIIIACNLLLLFRSSIDNFSRKNFDKRNEANEHLLKILYLRSFYADNVGNYIPVTPYTPFGGKVAYHYETLLAASLIDIAQLIAIGKPNEENFPPGFKRIFVEDEDWKEKVIQLLNEFDLVIFRPDKTDAVLWEIQTIFEMKFLHKTVFWMVIGDDDDIELQEVRYNIFKKKVFNLIGIEFPDYNRKYKFLYLDDKYNFQNIKDLRNHVKLNYLNAED